MELIQMILMVMVICTGITVLTIGLFSAPWYILLGVLGLVLLTIRRLMVNSTGVLEQLPPTANLIQQTTGETASKLLLTYRGSHYQSPVTSSLVDTPPTKTAHPDPGTSAEPSPELKYRGAPVNRSPG